MVQILFIDLDGTLFNDNCIVSDGNIDAIRRAKKKGVKVAIATGRGIFESDYALGDVDPDYFIGINGGEIRNYKTNEILFRRTMDLQSALLVKSLMDKHAVFYQLYTFETTYSTAKSLENIRKARIAKDYMDRFGSSIRLLNDIKGLDSVKFSALGVDNDKEFTDKLSKLESVYTVSSLAGHYEVIPVSIGKGKALKYLCEYLSIPVSDSMAIGDSGNDYEMLEVAGLSIAMDNGFEELKSIADHVTDTNDNDGVAKAIYKFIG